MIGVIVGATLGGTPANCSCIGHHYCVYFCVW